MAVAKKDQERANYAWMYGVPRQRLKLSPAQKAVRAQAGSPSG